MNRRAILKLSAILTVLGPPAVWAGDERVDYRRDVVPILSDACYPCHGPDPATRKARLRLDTTDDLLAERGSGRPVVPGHPEQSLVIERLTSAEPELRMPPPESRKSLSPEQLDVIRRWIAQGATTRGHWAYEPPACPEPPPSGSWARQPIDAFIAAAHTQRGLKPAPEADRATLLRRLSLDLTGLPPTPAELRQFLDDSRPFAYERQVDRLLASPRFGERMAQYWLDLVRYADTIGYHGDNHQDIWLYRDYVIEAFNSGLPFDRFTAEQLAGDLLPEANPRTRVASGYNRLLMTTREGGAQAKEYEAKYAADRVRNVSSVWLGATLGCAQCHDHKYDPYTTRDFYAMAAFFADLKETAVGEQQPTRIPNDDQAAQLARLDHLLDAVQRQTQTWTPALQASLQQWEAKRRMRLRRWRSAVLCGIDGDASIDGTDTVVPSPQRPGRATYRLTLASDLESITGLRLTAELDNPSAAATGNRLVEVQVADIGHPVAIARAAATPSRRNGSPEAALDGNPQTSWLIPANARPVELVLQLDRPIDVSLARPLSLSLHFEHAAPGASLRLRFDVTDEPGTLDVERPLPDEIEAILEIEPDRRDPAQRESLVAYYRAVAPELAAARSALVALRAQRQQIEEGLPLTLVSEALPRPRVVRILPRGNWLDESGEVVEPAPPAFLAGSVRSDRRLSRLDLARWLCDGSNPLVARVFVNRIWSRAFGRGLVATPDDFGAQGAPPSHPGLLDWLASDFQSNGWDVKRLWRLIVTSSTYRQSSRTSPAQRQLDPDNIWLARQGQIRLDAETIRDQALAASGLLVEQLGGPSVKPYQPAGYWSYLNFPPREYQPDSGPNLYRRGLYTYWCRTFLHPSLLAFDAPTREECTAQRPRSNTPMQALVLLNDPIYVELARALAERVMREAGPEIPTRIARAYELVLTRSPRPQELATLTALYERHRSAYAADPGAAAALLGVGQWPTPSDLPADDLAATTSVMRAVLNLHESLMRY
ncbi:MAG: hypothetical protein KatS3mg108_3388 [Isosphaeraceae bacterium]|nr:MAG: hypothetical protein KatS3mg108_3388 [Isosphaeraceae bacterium]